MGFCRDQDYEAFFDLVPEFERMLMRSGRSSQILVLNHRRRTGIPFPLRINDPLKQWKLSPMDLECRKRGNNIPGEGNPA